MHLTAPNRDGTVMVTIDIDPSLSLKLFPDQIPGEEQGPAKVELLTICTMIALSVSGAIKSGVTALESLQALNNAIRFNAEQQIEQLSKAADG